VESGRVLMEFSSKCDERSRLAVTRWFLVEKVLLKQDKQQDILKEGVNGL
jgi:hypothetical protein